MPNRKGEIKVQMKYGKKYAREKKVIPILHRDQKSIVKKFVKTYSVSEPFFSATSRGGDIGCSTLGCGDC